MPRAVFFDLVGTLVDQESDVAAHERLMGSVKRRYALEDAVPELLGEYHVLGADLFEEERRRGMERGPSFERAYTACFVAMLERRGFEPGEQDEAWFHDAYLRCHRERVRLVPEAKRCLAAVRKLPVHLGVISDIDAVMLDDHLDFLGLRGVVDSATSSEDAGALKPDERVFRAALERAGCEPREALMVGDSLERDVDGALAVGMHAVLIDRHNARVASVPRLRSLRRVPKLARRLLGV